MDAARDAELAERGRLLVAAAVADVQAPPALRHRLEHQRQAGVPVRRRRRLAFGGLLAGATAMALVVALLVAPGGTPGAPTIVEAARVGALPPEAPPPPRARDRPRELAVAAAGIAFPAWQTFGWSPAGVRRDDIEGREVTTVTYRTAARASVAYSIVDGEALKKPEGASTRNVEGISVTTHRAGGRWIVTWVRDGHTCIITAPATVPLDKLVALPAW
jgi:hypothetical protein